MAATAPVRQVNGRKPTDAKGLHAKMAEVVSAIPWQPKTGRNEKQNYPFVTAENIKAAVRDELASRGLMFYTSVESVEHRDFETKSGSTMFLTTITGQFTVIDSETGESFMFGGAGTGFDTGDKGLYKAMTAMLKNALIDTFLIPTGDDPENESPEVRRPVRPVEHPGVPPASPSDDEPPWPGEEAVTQLHMEPAVAARSEGLSARDFFERTDNAGIPRPDVTKAAKKMYGDKKWKVTELTDGERWALWTEELAPR